MNDSLGTVMRRVVLVGALGTWFLATTIKQDPTGKFTRFERSVTAALLLPEWRFFAPNPGVHDIHLLYRDKCSDGNDDDFTRWTEAWPPTPHRLSHVLWYPDRRMEKVLLDCMQELQILVHRRVIERNKDVQVTMPYLTILNFVCNRMAHHSSAVSTQFLLARSCGYEETVEPHVLFLSNTHPIVSSRYRQPV